MGRATRTHRTLKTTHGVPGTMARKAEFQPRPRVERQQAAHTAGQGASWASELRRRG
jgi:hypothetical protein